MTLYKKFVLLFLLIGQVAFAQTVIATKQSQRIKGENAVGYATFLEAQQQEVNTSLQRYLKTFGKPKQQGEMSFVQLPSVNGIAYTSSLYATAKANETKTVVWMGILEKADTTTIASQLEALVKAFGINFYRDKIQVQIDEAQRAVQAVEKQQQRTATENKNIGMRIENNKKEFLQLNKAIKSNRQDSVDLNLKLQKNFYDKDSLALVLDKVKKALEFQKDRQKNVN
jgi:hypothetical protein